jgi:hypothetical protein
VLCVALSNVVVSAFRRTSRVLRSAPPELDARATAYREAARAYCALIDGHRQHSRAAFVRELERSLAFLYHAGSQLPDVTPTRSNVHQAEDKGGDRFRSLFGSLRAFLGDYDVYTEVFDPLDPNDKPDKAHLAGDLAEIYEDSIGNLKMLDHPEVSIEDVLWDWRFSFTHHWANHCATALRVVSVLVHLHYAGEADD